MFPFVYTLQGRRLVCSSLLASAVPLSLFQPPSTAHSPLQVGRCSGLEGGNSSPQRALCQPWASKVKMWLAGADELLHTHPCSSSLAVFLQGKHQGSASSSLLANAKSRVLPDITPHKQQLFPPFRPLYLLNPLWEKNIPLVPWPGMFLIYWGTAICQMPVRQKVDPLYHIFQSSCPRWEAGMESERPRFECWCCYSPAVWPEVTQMMSVSFVSPFVG